VKTQQVVFDARVTQVRALKSEIDRLKGENARLRDENAALSHHLDLAILAACDLQRMPPGGTFVLVDGWNLVLGAQKEAASAQALLERQRAYLEEHPLDFVWVVFDGPKASASTQGRLRVSYTGGTGPHRADRLICDFLRMAARAGFRVPMRVLTQDKDLRKMACRLGADCV
jgi:hypothetical protein